MSAPDRIPQDVLEKYLWGSATLLRTHIDAGSYKQYIFPLLFFKRLCDVYDEKRAADLAKYGEDAELYADDYLFKIPAGARWKDVLETPEDVGEALVKAFKAIENENPEQLTGIFGDAAWTNKNRLPDRLLKDLLAHFGTQTLSLARCPEDELGKGYEYLIKQFADDSGHTAQEFYTNRTVVALMTEMLRPKSNESIYDPTCGSGGMLISAIKWLQDRGEEYRNVKVYGQEINAITSAIARMNLFLHGIADFHIANADTLKYPAFVKGGHLQTFDMVLANPPYSISQWDRTAFEDDKYGRNFLGTPPQSRADYAFIQHILKSLDPKTGRCAILLPHGILFRNEEKSIREKLVKSDLVEAVIGLAANLFFNSPMEACVLICRAEKPPERRGKILFVNAVKEVERKNTESYLTQDHVAKIAAAYRDFATQDEFAYVAAVDEIAAKSYSLNIPLYVRSKTIEPEHEELSFDEALTNWYGVSDGSSQSLAALSGTGYATDRYRSAMPLGKMFGGEKVSFGAVAKECRETLKDTTGQRIVGLEHLEPEDLALEHWSESADNTFTKAFHKGQLLFGRRRAYLKKAAVASFDGICSGDITVIEPIPGKLDPELLPFVVQNDRFFDFAVGGSAGSLSPRVKWEHLADYEFTLPPLEEQKKLAEALWAMERTKRAYKKLLTETDHLVEARFVEMFGDPVKNSLNYPTKKLASLGELNRGVSKARPRNTPDLLDGPYPLVQTGEVSNAELYITTYNATYSEKGLAQSRMWKTGTLCITIAANIAQTGILSFDACFPDSVVGFVPDATATNAIFVHFWFGFFQKILESQAPQVAQKNINLKILSDLDVINPPLALQREFAAFVGEAEKAKAALKESLAAITAAQKALMNGAFK